MNTDPTSDVETMVALHKALMHAIIDNGGDGRHVLKLVGDCRGDRVFFNALAQQLIGRIWELTRTPVDLGPIDFDSRLRDFYDAHPKVEVISGARDIDWTESRPEQPCRYVLTHFPMPMSYQNIRTAPVQHAGIRELILYIERLSGEDIGASGLIAAGSMAKHHRGGEVDERQPTFAAARVDPRASHVSWHGVKRPETDRWGLSCFYLIRQPIV